MAETPATPSNTDDDPFDFGEAAVAAQTTEEPKQPSLPPRGPDGKFVSPAANDAPKHPDSLVRQAAEFGLDDEQINSLSTPALYRHVNALLRRDREIAQSFATQRTLDTPPAPQPAPAEPEAADPLDALVSEGFDQRLIDAIKQSKHGSAKQIAALKKELAERDERSAKQAVNDNIRLVDAAFKKLASPLLGDLSGAELQKAGRQAEFKRRVAVLNAAGITDLRQVDRFSIMSQLREAYQTLFGDLPEADAAPGDAYSAALSKTPPRGKKFTQEEWNNGASARPSQRNGGPELKGEALAIKNLTERFREQDARRADADELEGIPE